MKTIEETINELETLDKLLMSSYQSHAIMWDEMTYGKGESTGCVIMGQPNCE